MTSSVLDCSRVLQVVLIIASASSSSHSPFWWKKRRGGIGSKQRREVLTATGAYRVKEIAVRPEREESYGPGQTFLSEEKRPVHRSWPSAFLDSAHVAQMKTDSASAKRAPPQTLGRRSHSRPPIFPTSSSQASSTGSTPSRPYVSNPSIDARTELEGARR